MKNREVESLEAQFGLAGAVAVVEGNEGLPKVTLRHGSGARAEVYLHGATVTSWTDAAGRELLFLSRESLFKEGVAIRGGIPICFPQFSEGPLPKHGLVRTAEWKLRQTKTSVAGEAVAVFGIEDSPESLKIWPFPFAVELAVVLSGDGLSLGVTVRNKGERAFEFNLALHTYFRVGDIRKTRVSGLRGVALRDFLRENRQETEGRDEIPFAGETDRIYRHAPERVQIRDEANGRTISVAKRNMGDVVIWNPWSEKAKRLQDFGDEEYVEMLCVETGDMDPGAKVGLEAGRQWQGGTELKVEG